MTIEEQDNRIKGEGNIKVVSVLNFARAGMVLSIKTNPKFSYSKTGSIKYDSIYKAAYFKKEKLNSYECVYVGHNIFVLFTNSFEIDIDKLHDSLLNFYIARTEMAIENTQSQIINLNERLNYEKEMKTSKNRKLTIIQ